MCPTSPSKRRTWICVLLFLRKGKKTWIVHALLEVSRWTRAGGYSRLWASDSSQNIVPCESGVDDIKSDLCWELAIKRTTWVCTPKKWVAHISFGFSRWTRGEFQPQDGIWYNLTDGEVTSGFTVSGDVHPICNSLERSTLYTGYLWVGL